MNGRTTKLRRAVILAVVIFTLALTGVLVYAIRDIWTSNAVVYRRTHITPQPEAVCPGETFTFPVSAEVVRSESVSRITEGWCRADTGICPSAMQSTPLYLNFVSPYSVEATGKRSAPPDMEPGEWQLRHCNETHSTGQISVACYQVDVTVLDCK